MVEGIIIYGQYLKTIKLFLLKLLLNYHHFILLIINLFIFIYHLNFFIFHSNHHQIYKLNQHLIFNHLNQILMILILLFTLIINFIN
jgi:hypothetical protein